MSLSSSKANGQNSIPTKILRILINDVSSQLAEVFNFSFLPWCFRIKIKN